MAKKVLFIVEGYNDEPDLIAKMYSSCFLGKSDTYEFYVFDTNIHQLAPKLIVDGAVDDDLDLKLVLRSEETDPKKLNILSQKYSDIFMIFDFDPQQRNVDLKNIGVLLAYFTDSTEMGKLFINYPMMQSYKHLTALPDLNFIGKQADHPDVLHYKELVDEQSLAELKQVKKYTFETFVSLTAHHLMQGKHPPRSYHTTGEQGHFTTLPCSPQAKEQKNGYLQRSHFQNHQRNGKGNHPLAETLGCLGRMHQPCDWQALQPLESNASWQGWRVCHLQPVPARGRQGQEGRKSPYGCLLEMD